MGMASTLTGFILKNRFVPICSIIAGIGGFFLAQCYLGGEQLLVMAAVAGCHRACYSWYHLEYPQNAKPYGEWNTAKIMVYKGTVVHGQNGQNVLEYHLWTPKWTEMLQASKFSEEAWPTAFKLLNNCGGDNHEGFIGFQDHGDNVYFRNIRVKLMD